MNNSHIDFVLRTLEERDVKFVRLWFCDVLGALKSVAVSPAEIPSAFEEGIGFDGSSIEGFSRVSESDMLAFPDPLTFQILPWRGKEEPVARMFCDIKTPSGEPSLSDSRQVLKKVLDNIQNMGYSCYTHPEIEFYLLEQGSVNSLNPKPVDQAGYFDNDPGGVASDFRRKSIGVLEELSIPVEYSHHEAGHGQSEIDLRYADALTTSDNILTFRTVIKEVALGMGLYATFMPKPLKDQPGSGMHTHFSLFEGETNIFYDAYDKYGISIKARQFMAGVLKYAPDFTAITNQYVNSYKRLFSKGEAPSTISWGRNNMSALVRVPVYKQHKPQSARIEYRGLDSAANPYLAYACIISAGVKGIQDALELPKEAEENIWQLNSLQRKSLGIKELPDNLSFALKNLKDSEFIAEILGEKVFNFFIENKTKEWASYRRQITDFELKNNLLL